MDTRDFLRAQGSEKMSNGYNREVELEKEVLSECVAGLGAQYFHYANELGVLDNREHPVMKIKSEIHALDDVIRECKTMEELKEVNRKRVDYAIKLRDMKGLAR